MLIITQLKGNKLKYANYFSIDIRNVSWFQIVENIYKK